MSSINRLLRGSDRRDDDGRKDYSIHGILGGKYSFSSYFYYLQLRRIRYHYLCSWTQKTEQRSKTARSKSYVKRSFSSHSLFLGQSKGKGQNNNCERTKSQMKRVCSILFPIIQRLIDNGHETNIEQNQEKSEEKNENPKTKSPDIPCVCGITVVYIDRIWLFSRVCHSCCRIREASKRTNIPFWHLTELKAVANTSDLIRISEGLTFHWFRMANHVAMIR